MLKQKQQNLIEQNLQTIIIENKAKIMLEFMHSPEMYKMLIENKTTKRPQEQQILPVLFECALRDEIFMKKNMGILLKENLSQEEKQIVLNNITESLLGQVWKGVKKLGGLAWDGVKWVFNNYGRGPKPSLYNPGRRPGRWGDDFMPTWRKPDGTWQTWDPGTPHWPGRPAGPFAVPGSQAPDIGPPPMVPDWSHEIPNPFWSLPPEE